MIRDRAGNAQRLVNWVTRYVGLADVVALWSLSGDGSFPPSPFV